MHSFNFCLLWRRGPKQVRTSSFLSFPDHTQRYTKFGRTPLDELSSRRRDLSLTTDNTHNTQSVCSGIRTHIPSRRAAADPHLRSRSHWDRNSLNLTRLIYKQRKKHAKTRGAMKKVVNPRSGRECVAFLA